MNKMSILALICFLLLIPMVSKYIGEKQFSGQNLSVEQLLALPSIKNKLKPGEKILWSSTVDQQRTVDNAMPVAYMGVVTFLFSLFGIFRMKRAYSGRGPQWFGLVFMVPFVLVSLYMLTSPYWAIKNSKESICLLTDTRALAIIAGMTSTNVRYTRRSMTPIKIRKQGADVADVIFYEDDDVHKGFNGVHDAENCARILKDQIEAADIER